MIFSETSLWNWQSLWNIIKKDFVFRKSHSLRTVLKRFFSTYFLVCSHCTLEVNFLLFSFFWVLQILGKPLSRRFFPLRCWCTLHRQNPSVHSEFILLLFHFLLLKNYWELLLMELAIKITFFFNPYFSIKNYLYCCWH